MFQISVTYAFTEVIHVQSDTLENFGNVDGKEPSTHFSANLVKTKAQSHYCGLAVDGKTHVFVGGSLRN